MDKFTDRDVRENIHLGKVAVRFLENYGGDFDFLVAAKRASRKDELTIQMVRGTLNCMRSDFKGALMLAEATGDPSHPMVARELAREERPLVVVPPLPEVPPTPVTPPRPDHLTLKARVREPFVRKPNGVVVHRAWIDGWHDSELRYYSQQPRAIWIMQNGERIFYRLEVPVLCGQDASTRGKPVVMSEAERDAWFEDFSELNARACKQCEVIEYKTVQRNLAAAKEAI